MISQEVTVIQNSLAGSDMPYSSRNTTSPSLHSIHKKKKV